MQGDRIETFNKFVVGSQAGGIRVMMPLGLLTPDDALLLAAWLGSMAEHNASHKFEEVLKAVQGT